MAATHHKRSSSEMFFHGKGMVVVIFLLLVVVLLGIAHSLHHSPVASRLESKFIDLSIHGLAIVPASAESYVYCTVSADQNNSGRGFSIPTNVTNRIVVAQGYSFCINNNGGPTYFIPAATPSELASFYNAISGLPGLSR